MSQDDENETVTVEISKQDYETLREKWGSVQRAVRNYAEKARDEDSKLVKNIRNEDGYVHLLHLSEDQKKEIKQSDLEAVDLIENHFTNEKIAEKDEVREVLEEIYATSTARKKISFLRDEIETVKTQEVIDEIDAESSMSRQKINRRLRKSKKEKKEYFVFNEEDVDEVFRQEKENVSRAIKSASMRNSHR